VAQIQVSHSAEHERRQGDRTDRTVLAVAGDGAAKFQKRGPRLVISGSVRAVRLGEDTDVQEGDR
jgi:hypothetical protein